MRTLLLGYGLTAAFVVLSGAVLPERVASHFDAGGAANGYLPRSMYLLTMLVVCALPVLACLAAAASLRNPRARINLPHRAVWLAPDRREETVRRIRRGMGQFSACLLVFLWYVQWLVVRANRHSPAHLPTAWMLGGLVVFVVVTVVWLRGFLWQFRASRACNAAICSPSGAVRRRAAVPVHGLHRPG